MQHQVATSLDGGSTWTGGGLLFGPSADPQGVAYGAATATWVVVAQCSLASCIAVSPDGLMWSTSSASFKGVGVTFSARLGLWIAASVTPPYVFTATDPLSAWTPQPNVTVGAHAFGVLEVAPWSRILVGGNGAPTVSVTTDAKTFFPVQAAPFATSCVEFAYKCGLPLPLFSRGSSQLISSPLAQPRAQFGGGVWHWAH